MLNKFKNIEGMGVYILMSHLLITVLLIGIYAFSMYSGEVDETLKTIMTVVVGFWFGAVGKEAISTKKVNEDNKKGED